VSFGPVFSPSRNPILRGSAGCGLLLIFVFLFTAVATVVSQTAPYSVRDVEKLAKQGTEEHAFLESVRQHGIDFAPTLGVMEELKADQVLDSVLKEIGKHIPQDRAPDFYLKEGERFEEKGLLCGGRCLL
jgi:hypothetical protein